MTFEEVTDTGVAGGAAIAGAGVGADIMNGGEGHARNGLNHGLLGDLEALADETLTTIDAVVVSLAIHGRFEGRADRNVTETQSYLRITSPQALSSSFRL